MGINLRSSSGKKAKAFGDLFETMFQMACRRANIAVTRIPDSCKSLGAQRLVRVKSPFDWICSCNGKTVLIDTKTSNTDSFPYSKISPHQVLSLLEHERAGCMAGYVIWLRKTDEVIFVKASMLDLLIGCRGTIKPGRSKIPAGCMGSNDDIIELGSGKMMMFHLSKLFYE